MKKISFIGKNYGMFIDSFKRINLKFFLILAYDILFYFIFMQVGNLFVKMIEKKAAGIDLEQNLLGMGQQAATSMLVSVRGFFFFLIFSALSFLVVMIINWSIFKGLIWVATANKKFNLKFFKKFFLLNIIWLPSWSLLVFLFAVIIEPVSAPIFILITLIIAFYFTNILYPLFLKENRLSRIKDAFSLGIKKIHHFIVPYLIIIALFYAIYSIYNFIALKTFLNQNVFFGIILVFAAWIRYYFVGIVASLSR